MEFDSFGALAAHFESVAHRLPKAIERELDATGKATAAAVKALFGKYGPGWAVLTERTQAERQRQGYTPNDPLLRSGTLMGLVTHSADASSVTIGIPDGTQLSEPYRKGTIDAQEVMDTHEFGSTDGRIPARPVFGQVFFHADEIANALVVGVLGRVKL